MKAGLNNALANRLPNGRPSPVLIVSGNAYEK